MKRDEFDFISSLLDKQDTIIGMLQMVVRAVYDAQRGATSGAGSVSVSGGSQTSGAQGNLPLPLPAAISNVPLPVDVNNTPLPVNVNNTPLPVNVNNTPLSVSQSGTWTVQIANQPISVVFGTANRYFVPISVNTSGDTTLVAAISGKKIRVVALAVVASGDVEVRFKSGTTAITGKMRFGTGGGLSHSFDGGLFQTNTNQSLVIELSSAVAVGGYLVYEEVV